MSIGERIKSLRGKVSQKDFAQQMGIAQNTLGNYERGERNPSLEFIHSLISQFNVSYEWLITGSGSRRDVPVDGHSVSEGLRQQSSTACPRCEKLEGQLEKDRELNRELSAENRQLWKENGELKVKVGELNVENVKLAGELEAARDDCQRRLR